MEIKGKMAVNGELKDFIIPDKSEKNCVDCKHFLPPIRLMKNKEKILGQYFTPTHVADFMISLSKVSKSGKILEPSCGKGVFLKLLEEKGYKNVTGYEIDNTLYQGINKNIVFKSFVSEIFKEKYDLIIGNPPYIRWKNLEKELKKELDNNELWKKYFNSLCDYLYIFILKSVEILKDNGELIFITPEYWINTKHSQSLRDYLVSNGYITDIIHFNETPIFDKVASSILIFRFVKSKTLLNNRIKIIKYHSSKRVDEDTLNKIKNNTENNEIKIFERDMFLPGKHWVLATNEIENKLEEYENKCNVITSQSLFGTEFIYSTLGDIADIGNGLVSGLDYAFQIPSDVNLSEKELKATIPVLKAKNINQYLHGDTNKYMFLNGIIEKENILVEEYPTFYKLLSKFKDQLNRRYNYNRNINYWEWVFLRNFNLFRQEREKIFIPCKERISHKSHFRFSLVQAGIYPTQDVTAIYLKPEIKESVYYILAQLNSDLVFEWLRHKGVVKGNIVEFSEKPLASIPIKLINWENKQEVKMHDEITFLCKEYILKNNLKIIKDIQEKVTALF
jgi:adenine-specific DNA-methyltransferase